MSVDVLEEGEGEGMVLEIENSQDDSRFSLSLVRGSARVWRASLATPCLLAAASPSHACAAACQDRSISLFSTSSGRLLTARLFLPDVCYQLQAQGSHLMAVLCSAEVYVWDVRTMRTVVRGVSFSHLLLPQQQQSGGGGGMAGAGGGGAKGGGSKQQQQQQLVLGKCLMTRDGLPVLKIGSSSFVFNADMQCWMELASTSEISEIQASDLAPPKPKSSTSLTSLEDLQRTLANDDDSSVLLQRVHHGAGGSASSSSSLSGSAHQQQTLAYLESQVSRCLCLKSPLEYRHWSRAYVQYLVHNDLEGRLREFCGQFCSPSGLGGAGGVAGGKAVAVGAGGGAGGEVMGFEKLELLREWLGVIAKNHKLQRLYTELKEAVDMS